jgi:outer membrane biosynthesis protein TonB
MAILFYMPNMELPWSSSVDDNKRYHKILRVCAAIMVVISLIVTFVTVPEVTREEKEKLPPQLARVLLEKKELPPPKPVEPPKPEEKKPEEKKPEEKKPEEKKPEPKEPVKPPPKKDSEKAREKAQNSGVMEFKDDLAEMREMLQTSAVETAATTVTNSTGPAAQVDRSMITSGAKVASGGINTAALSRDTGGTALSGRQTTKVTSDLAEAGKKSGQAAAGNSNGTGGVARSEEEIRKVMEQHKGAIYSIYNRALRQNAALQGKLVVKIVIDPNGRVVEATLVSSELRDPDLESKILSRIKLISFPASNVVRTTINQTFDFLPQ